MKKETIRYTTNNQDVKVWQPTCNLRWLKQGLGDNVHKSYAGIIIKTLQQMWTSNLGDIEWREIPIEND
jgi:hypothetical protein